MKRFLAGGALLLAVAAAPGGKLPKLRAGMWDFKGSIGGHPINARRCADPTRDMERQNEEIRSAGCSVTPVTVKGSVYSFSTDCRLEAKGKDSLVSHTRTLLTVRGEDAYTVEVDGTTNGAPTRQRIEARRVGDCPK